MVAVLCVSISVYAEERTTLDLWREYGGEVWPIRQEPVTAHESTTSGLRYCERGDGSIYSYVERNSGTLACGENFEIAKTVFDLRMGNTFSVTYCRREDGTVYRQDNYLACGYDTQVTKAEYDRLKHKKSTTAVASNDSEIIDTKQSKKSSLEILDAPYVTLNNANVRERPDVNSGRITTLAKGSEITALGRVPNSNWYLISRNGEKLGYVFGSLIAEARAVPLEQIQ